MDEITSAQIVGFYPGMSGVGEADFVLPATYDTYRAMRKQPTIALARLLHIAPILNGKWSVGSTDAAPENAVDLVEDGLLPLRSKILRAALESRIDFGFAPFEIVWKVAKDDDAPGLSRIQVGKLKPLLQDITVILIDRATGDLVGFKQGDITVPFEKTLLLSGKIEGQNWYGEPLLENVRDTYRKWLSVEDRAARYDRKIAGANVVIHYPPGKTTRADGVEKDNYEIAEEALAALDKAGGLILPHLDVITHKNLSPEQLKELGWQFDYLGDPSPKQITFIPRFEYLDKLFFRGMLWPERAVSEGHFGTKAEAEAHADFGILNLMVMSGEIVSGLNEQVVDRLLELNYGPRARGTVFIEDAPLVDTDLHHLRSIFTTAWSNPTGLLQLMGMVDFDQLMSALNIPKAQDRVGPANVADVGDADAGNENPADAIIRQMYENGPGT